MLQVNQSLSLTQNLPREYLGIYQNTSGIQIPSWVSQMFFALFFSENSVFYIFGIDPWLVTFPNCTMALGVQSLYTPG